MLLTMGLSGMPSLCTLGSPYNVGGLEPAGHSCRRVSSVIDDFFSNLRRQGITEKGINYIYNTAKA